MTPTAYTRSRGAILFVAPAVLLAGWLYHPYIALPRASDVAGAAASDPTRWGLAHVTVGVGYGLMALAFLALRASLRAAGEERWSVRALPLAVLGSSLITILTGMEFAPLTAAETGADVEAVQEELVPWFPAVALVSGLCFALGTLGFAVAIARSGVASPGVSRFVVVALVVLAVAHLVPLGAAFYVRAAAGVAALWPLGYLVREQSSVGVEGRPRPTPAT